MFMTGARILLVYSLQLGSVMDPQWHRRNGFDGFGRTHQFLEESSRTHQFFGEIQYKSIEIRCFDIKVR